MGLFSDTVPRELYDRKCAEYDALLEKYHSLRLIGNAPVSPIRTSMPKPDTGTAALKDLEQRAHSPRVLGMAANLRAQKPELTQEEALAEAVRLDGFIAGRAMVPPAGGG